MHSFLVGPQTDSDCWNLSKFDVLTVPTFGIRKHFSFFTTSQKQVRREVSLKGSGLKTKQERFSLYCIDLLGQLKKIEINDMQLVISESAIMIFLIVEKCVKYRYVT